MFPIIKLREIITRVAKCKKEYVYCFQKMLIEVEIWKAVEVSLIYSWLGNEGLMMILLRNSK